MQNELPKIDIPVDCVAGTDITKELLNLLHRFTLPAKGWDIRIITGWRYRGIDQFGSI